MALYICISKKKPSMYEHALLQTNMYLGVHRFFFGPQGSYSKYWEAEVVRMGMHSGRTTPFLINTINMTISKYPH